MVPKLTAQSAGFGRFKPLRISKVHRKGRILSIGSAMNGPPWRFLRGVYGPGRVRQSGAGGVGRVININSAATYTLDNIDDRMKAPCHYPHGLAQARVARAIRDPRRTNRTLSLSLQGAIFR